MSRLSDRGYRVVMIGRDDATERDVTHLASALKYESRLPGGHATCSFTLSGPAREARALARHLDEVKVYFGDLEVWNGRVEESDPKADGSLAVTALGWSADLKAQQFTRLFVEGGYGRWAEASSIGFPNVNSAGDFTFASPTTAGSDGVAVEIAVPASVSMTTPPVHSIVGVYIVPQGCTILKFTATLSWFTDTTFDYTGGIETTDTLPATSWVGVVSVSSASDGYGSHSEEVSITGPLVGLDFSMAQVSSPDSTTSKNYWRLTGCKVIGAYHPDTGAVLQQSEIVADLVVRNLIADFGGGIIQSSAERMRPGATPFTDLVFDKPSTIEDALKRVCDVEGWTWGVFDRKLMSLGPIEHITTAPSRDTPNLRAGTPPWWMALRGEDHTTDVTHTLQGVVNRVFVPYTDDSAIERVLTVEDFDNPLNPLNKPGYPPRQIRTATVSLQGSTPNYSVAVAAANAYLAQYGRPAAAGQITLADRSVLEFVWGYDPATPLMIDGAFGLDVGQLGSEVPQAPPSSRPASAVLPGWWVHIPDGTDAMYDSQSTASSSATRTPPGGLLVIRSVKVDADRGEVTLDIDSGRDAFDRFQARLAAG